MSGTTRAAAGAGTRARAAGLAAVGVIAFGMCGCGAGWCRGAAPEVRAIGPGTATPPSWQLPLGSASVTAIAAAPDGGVVVVGYFRALVVLGQRFVSSSEGDAFVLRLDGKGALLWVRTFGVTADDDPARVRGGDVAARAVAVGADGRIGVGGWMRGRVDFGSGVLGAWGHNAHVAFAVALDADGKTIAAHGFDTDGADAMVASVAVSGGSLVVAIGASRGDIVRLTPQGEEAWRQPLARRGDPLLASRPDGSIAVASASYSDRTTWVRTLDASGRWSAAPEVAVAHFHVREMAAGAAGDVLLAGSDAAEWFDDPFQRTVLAKVGPSGVEWVEHLPARLSVQSVAAAAPAGAASSGYVIGGFALTDAPVCGVARAGSGRAGFLAAVEDDGRLARFVDVRASIAPYAIALEPGGGVVYASMSHGPRDRGGDSPYPVPTTAVAEAFLSR